MNLGISGLLREGIKMEVGEFFKEGNKRMLWVICPICKEERGTPVRTREDLPSRLCKVCNLNNAKVNMESLWLRK